MDQDGHSRRGTRNSAVEISTFIPSRLDEPILPPVITGDDCNGWSSDTELAGEVGEAGFVNRAEARLILAFLATASLSFSRYLWASINGRVVGDGLEPPALSV